MGFKNLQHLDMDLLLQVKCEDIERSYLAGKATHTFTTGEFSYNIHFQEMVQENLDQRYRTKREIRRRPKQITEVVA